MPTASYKRYWACQITGWAFYLFFGIVMSYLAFKQQPAMYAVQFIGTFLFLGVTHLQRYLAHRQQWITLSLGKLILLILLYNAIGSFLVQIIVSVCMLAFGIFEWKQYNFGYLALYCMNGIVILSFWSTIYFAYQFILRWKQKEVEAWKLQLSLKEAELEAIRSQLNPHFLFNSLNNIRSLVLEDQAKAREMITRLSAMMRYVIGYNQQPLVTVAEEIEFLENYISLEKIHFENRLEFEAQADSAAKSAAIPPLGIQLLVENAIKHGISQQINGGKILLTINRQNGHLHVQVKNTGTLLPSVPAGIGIDRLSKRISHSLGADNSFSLHQADDNWVEASLLLPWKEYESLYS